MSSTRKQRPGAIIVPVGLARVFIQKRLAAFVKDMGICLTGIPRLEGPAKMTHAYFPALMSCCSTLEYLAALSIGHNNSLGHKEIAAYAAKYMDASYDGDTVRVLFEAFRNNVAHRGIAPGVWCDKLNCRRITWRIEEGDDAPALSVTEEPGTLTIDAPWPTPYTHRMHIHLGHLWQDIHNSGYKYVAELEHSPDLQRKFTDCMMDLYPT